MKISARILRRTRACVSQVNEFVNVFGEASITVTEELCVSYAPVFDWDWAAKNLLPSRLYADYADKFISFEAEYKAKRAPLYANYAAKCAALAALRAEDVAKFVSFDAEYAAERDEIYAEYAAERDEIYDDLAAARAALFGRLAERTYAIRKGSLT